MFGVRQFRRVAHEAAERRRAVQRALRAAQHFEALEIVGKEIEDDRRARAVVRARTERRLVDVRRDRRARADRRNTAEREDRLAGRAAVLHDEAGQIAGEIGQLRRVHLLELLLADHADRHRDLLHVLAALLGGDDDRAERLRIGVGVGCRRSLLRPRRGRDDGEQKCDLCGQELLVELLHDFLSSRVFGCAHVEPSRRRKLPPSTSSTLASL